MRRSLSILINLVLLAGLLSSCQDRNYYAVGGYAQGGTWSIKYRGASIRPDKVQTRADSLLREIDFTLSGYNKASLLSRLNSGEKVVPNAMFADLYRLSYEMWEESEGAFDIACAPLFDIWGFGFTSDKMPSDSLVRATLSGCGTAHLVRPEAVDEMVRQGREISASDLSADGTRAPRLNFNAIAQGYSCDVLAAMLLGLGASDMLVDIGEIWCCGLNPSGKGWTVAIDNPEDGNETPGKDVRGKWVGDGGRHGIVTSGNYRKFYIRDGKKYAHTIDPRTGYPVSHSLLSATVVCESAARADALATVFMVIGYDAAREYLNSHPELEACLITSEGVWASWD